MTDFHANFPALTACQVALACARHRMLDQLLAGLRYDPRPPSQSLDIPPGLKTRREALGTPNQDDVELAHRLEQRSLEQQQCWCNCHLGRWLRQGVARFGTE